jgi:hypothetical protein
MLLQKRGEDICVKVDDHAVVGFILFRANVMVFVRMHQEQSVWAQRVFHTFNHVFSFSLKNVDQFVIAMAMKLELLLFRAVKAAS